MPLPERPPRADTLGRLQQITAGLHCNNPPHPKCLRNIQKLSRGKYQFQEALWVNGFPLDIHPGCSVLNSGFTLSFDLSGRE